MALARAKPRLTDLEAELLAVVKRLEWGTGRRCPACAGWDVGPNGETDLAHTADCPVALVLAKAEAERV